MSGKFDRNVTSVVLDAVPHRSPTSQPPWCWEPLPTSGRFAGFRTRSAVAPQVIPPVTSKILVFDDDWIHTPTGPERALTALGIAYTIVRNPTDFEPQLGLQEWDLVIFANEYYGIGSGTLDLLQAYLSASKNHKAIVQCWDASSYPSHPLWATLGIQSPVSLTTPTPLHWWSPYHPLFNQPNEVPEFTSLTSLPGGYVYGASVTLTGSAGPGLGGFAGAPTAGQAGVVLSPDNRTIYKGLLDFCNDQDANGNGTWDVQEWWEDAIRTLYPHAWRILIRCADPYGASQYLSQLMLYPETRAIASADANAGTPTLDQLKHYDVVIVWSNSAFNDGATLGDRLADYVDAGGRVISAVFALGSGPPMALGGRFVSGGYRPFDGVGGGATADHSLGTHDASHRLMWGVSSFSGFYRQAVSPSAGSTLVASWDDGVPLMAAKGRVVALNAYVGGYPSNLTTGDVTTLFHNALAYLTSPRLMVLRAHDRAIGAPLAALRAIGDIALVDEMDVEVATPTLEQLLAYDVVMAYSDGLFDEPEAVGNMLADTADGGRGVLLATFDWQGDGGGGGIAGRIAGPTYSPFAFAGHSLYATSLLGDFDRTHPLMQGVSELSAYYRDNVSLNPGATLVASWADGFGAVGTQGQVTAINAYFGGATSHLTTGDGTTLLHNSAWELFHPSLKAVTEADLDFGSAPMPVSFLSGVSGGRPPYSYDWDFGDGSEHADTPNPAHTYASVGVFHATLTVTDSNSGTARATPILINVTAPLSATATATPDNGVMPLDVLLFAVASGGTAPYLYDWNFGDGTPHGSGFHVDHVYTAAGTFMATVTVTDSAPTPHVISASAAVTVKPPPPVITLMKKTSPPFTIVVTGSNLQNGIQVYINGALWNGVIWKKTEKIKITGGASLKSAVPKGVATTFRFVNPDTGEVTTTWSY